MKPIEQTAPTPMPGPSVPGASSAQKKNYIGSQLSIISKQGIRYVGTLIMINSQEQTLVLKNVKSMGSEGRRAGAGTEVPGSEKIYESIIFRANELQDFYVMATPDKEFSDPAIVSMKNSPPTEAPLGEGAPSGAEHQKFAEREYTEGIVGRGGHYSSYHYRGSSRGYHEQRPYLVGEFRASTNPTAEGTQLKDKYQEDFDFEKMNEKFASLFKESKQAMAESSKEKIPEEKYNKAKGFFDTISNSLSEKANQSQSEGSQFDYQKQRQIDGETFGFEPRGNRYEGRYRSHVMYGQRMHRGRGRGRYRGYQPRYRGGPSGDEERHRVEYVKKE